MKEKSFLLPNGKKIPVSEVSGFLRYKDETTGEEKFDLYFTGGCLTQKGTMQIVEEDKS